MKERFDRAVQFVALRDQQGDDVVGGRRATRARIRLTSQAPVCCNVVLPVENLSSNGQLCLNCLGQPRGQAAR